MRCLRRALGRLVAHGRFVRPLGVALGAMTLWGTCLSWVLAAEEGAVYDRVSFAATASAEVRNDLIVAVLTSRREGSDMAGPVAEVNERITAAVAKAKEVPAVGIQTLAYATEPIYREERLVGWRVSQSLRLESGDVEAIGRLIGELQQGLALRTVGYRISTERRREAEDELVAEVLEAFRARAQRITQELGRTRYRLVRLDINTADGPVPRPMRSVRMQLEASGPAPTLEAGTQRVQVSASGTIELQVQ